MTKLWTARLVGHSAPTTSVVVSVKLPSLTEFSSNMQFLHDQYKMAAYYNYNSCKGPMLVLGTARSRFLIVLQGEQNMSRYHTISFSGISHISHQKLSPMELATVQMATHKKIRHPSKSGSKSCSIDAWRKTWNLLLAAWSADHQSNGPLIYTGPLHLAADGHHGGLSSGGASSCMQGMVQHISKDKAKGPKDNFFQGWSRLPWRCGKISCSNQSTLNSFQPWLPKQSAIVCHMCMHQAPFRQKLLSQWMYHTSCWSCEARNPIVTP